MLPCWKVQCMSNTIPKPGAATPNPTPDPIAVSWFPVNPLTMATSTPPSVTYRLTYLAINPKALTRQSLNDRPPPYFSLLAPSCWPPLPKLPLPPCISYETACGPDSRNSPIGREGHWQSQRFQEQESLQEWLWLLRSPSLAINSTRVVS